MDGNESSAPSGVVIRRESGLPVYLQLVDQFRYLIGAGRYPVGSYLPRMREMADELGLNLNTINRAFRQLQRDGLIQSTPGKGARVVRSAVDVAQSTPEVASATNVSLDHVDAILAAALERALALGLSPKMLSARVDAILAEFSERIPPPPVLQFWAGNQARSAALATQLRGRTHQEFRVSDGPDAPLTDADILVRPRYGAWSPPCDTRAEHIDVLDLPVSVDRATVQAVLSIEPGAVVTVVAADEEVARWMLDTLGAFVAPKSSQILVAAAFSAIAVPRQGWLLCEADLDGDPSIVAASDRMLPVGVTFSPNVGAELESAIDRVRAVRRSAVSSVGGDA